MSRQPIIFMNVDFPEPEGPITATNAPLSMARETPLSAWKPTSPIRYVFTTSETSIIAGIVQYLSYEPVKTGRTGLARLFIFYRCLNNHPIPLCNISFDNLRIGAVADPCLYKHRPYQAIA